MRKISLILILGYFILFTVSRKEEHSDASEDFEDDREDVVERLEEVKSDSKVIHADEDDSYNYGSSALQEEGLLDEQMNFDFEPNDILNLQIPAWSDEEIFDDITDAPTTISGGFYVTDSEDSLVDFYIKDSNDNILFQRLQNNSGTFNHTIPLNGTYKLVICNKKFLSAKTIMLAYHKGDGNDVTKNDLLTVDDHLEFASKRLNVNINLKQTLMSDIIFASRIHEVHVEAAQDQKENALIFSVIESILIIGISAFQVFYIKRLIGNKLTF